MSFRFSLILLLSLASTIANAGILSGVAAVVNDEIITSAEVAKETASIIREMEKAGKVDVGARGRIGKEALGRLIDKKLIEQRIRDLNVKVSDEEVKQAIEDVKRQNNLSQENLLAALTSQGLSLDQYKGQIREQIERIRLLNMEVKAKVVTSEEEARDYYRRNVDSYSEGESYQARQIFFKVPKDATPAQVQDISATAEKVHAEASAGGDFAALASKYSQDPSAKDGGSLGAFKKGDMTDEFRAAIEGLKEGGISPVVKTAAGLHIIKLEAIVPGKVKPFEEVRGEIEERLFKKKSEERFTKWVEDLKKEATIDIRN